MNPSNNDYWAALALALELVLALVLVPVLVLVLVLAPVLVLVPVLRRWRYYPQIHIYILLLHV